MNCKEFAMRNGYGKNVDEKNDLVPPYYNAWILICCKAVQFTPALN